MKAILEFDLPEDKWEHDVAIRGGTMAVALYNIDQELFRPMDKHGYHQFRLVELVKQNPDFAAELVLGLREEYFMILRRYGLNLDELVV